MNATATTSPTIEPHEPHWVTKAAFPVVMTIFYLTQIALGLAVYWSLRLSNIRIDRLKEKLGTRALPTAELEL